MIEFLLLWIYTVTGAFFLVTGLFVLALSFGWLPGVKLKRPEPQPGHDNGKS